MKTYKWTKSEKDKVEKLIIKYKEKLNLQSWVIKFWFEDGVPKRGDETMGENFVAFATNSITPQYEKMDISFHASLLAEAREFNKFEIEDTVKHELCHCLTQDLFELSLHRAATQKECTDAVEKLTQRISRLI